MGHSKACLQSTRRGACVPHPLRTIHGPYRLHKLKLCLNSLILSRRSHTNYFMSLGLGGSTYIELSGDRGQSSFGRAPLCVALISWDAR